MDQHASWKTCSSAPRKNATGSGACIGRRSAHAAASVRRLSIFRQRSVGSVTCSDDHAGVESTRRPCAPATSPTGAQVLAAISAMSEPAAREPTWVFWRAKALMATAPSAGPSVGPSAGANPAPAEGLQHAGPLSSAPGSTAAAVSPQRAQRAGADAVDCLGAAAFMSSSRLKSWASAITLPPANRPPLTAARNRDAALAKPRACSRALHRHAPSGCAATGCANGTTASICTRPGGLSDREMLAAAATGLRARAVWDRCINSSERTPAREIDHRATLSPRPTAPRPCSSRTT